MAAALLLIRGDKLPPFLSSLVEFTLHSRQPATGTHYMIFPLHFDTSCARSLTLGS